MICTPRCVVSKVSRANVTIRHQWETQICAKSNE
jgi:hypothetical protein